MQNNYNGMKDYNKFLEHRGKVDVKRHSSITNYSVKCKNCGHSVLPVRERIMCNYCGHWIYKNDKIEFKYKMQEKIKKLAI